MKRTNWIAIAVLGAALSFSGVAQAQVTSTVPSTRPAMSQRPKLTPEQKQEKRLAHLRQKLNLSDAQVQQIRELWAQDKSKIKSEQQEVKSDAKGTPQRKADRKELKSDRQSMEQKLMAILSSQQQSELKALRQQEKSKRQERKAQRQGIMTPAPASK